MVMPARNCFVNDLRAKIISHASEQKCYSKNASDHVAWSQRCDVVINNTTYYYVLIITTKFFTKVHKCKSAKVKKVQKIIFLRRKVLSIFYFASVAQYLENTTSYIIQY
jgi:hypothetical protein